MSGLLKLVEILPQTKIESLECAAAPIVFAFVSAPADSPPPTLCIGSLAGNAICGLTTDYRGGHGEYTAEGITKLCEGLKGSAVTSLKCAATPKCLLLCQRALTQKRTQH